MLQGLRRCQPAANGCRSLATRLRVGTLQQCRIARRSLNTAVIGQVTTFRLQAVLVALLACLVWGGPFSAAPASQSSDGGSGTALSDREDVNQHLEGTMDAQAMANITEEELRYHYFQSHDFDGNKVLDGMEMLKAVYHATPEKAPGSEPADYNSDGGAEQDSGDDSTPPNDQFYVDVIDRLLSEGDLNQDGFLSYPEFVLSNERAIRRQQQQHMPQDQS